ncbi:MAG TPA: hypothetical protein EYP22_02615 [Methanosarcinales archaeon]|nr:hypothetical protein [Methanosarcinales archaeon]
MYENVSIILKKGYKTWQKNLNISIPILLQNIVSIILLFSVIGFLMLMISKILPKDPDDIIYVLTTDSTLLYTITHKIVITFFVFLIISSVVNAFFSAGAIGMAKTATIGNNTKIQEMIGYGKKFYSRTLTANLIINVIEFAGIVFLIPGYLKIADDQLKGLSCLITGFLAWGFYIMIMNIIFVVVKYAIIIEDISTIAGIKKSIQFFLSHLFDVIIVYMLMSIILIIINLISMPFSFYSHLELIGTMVYLVFTVIAVTITTIWWTRLYMDRTKRKFSERIEGK